MRSHREPLARLRHPANMPINWPRSAHALVVLLQLLSSSVATYHRQRRGVYVSLASHTQPLELCPHPGPPHGWPAGRSRPRSRSGRRPSWLGLGCGCAREKGQLVRARGPGVGPCSAGSEPVRARVGHGGVASWISESKQEGDGCFVPFASPVKPAITIHSPARS